MTDTLERTQVDPLEYFEYIKSMKQTATIGVLQNFYSVAEQMLQKAMNIGQDVLIRKLVFTLDVVEKEYKLLEFGIDTFVYREDIEKFIEEVDSKVVKIIELKNYPREIPSEIADVITNLKKHNIFDEYFIVFTDYTGSTERQVKAERRRKDPILFGVFLKEQNLHDRFYYLGDWEDEYCDLTLEKVIDHFAKNNKEVAMPVGLKNYSKEEIEAYASSLVTNNQSLRLMSKPKDSFFKRVKTAVRILRG